MVSESPLVQILSDRHFIQAKVCVEGLGGWGAGSVTAELAVQTWGADFDLQHSVGPGRLINGLKYLPCQPEVLHSKNWT